MNKEELFKVFEDMFPDWARKAICYKKIGSKTLAIKFVTSVEGNKVYEESRVFLYNDPNNWQFGTKLWRKRPEKLQKKNKEVKKDDISE